MTTLLFWILWAATVLAILAATEWLDRIAKKKLTHFDGKETS